MEWAFAETNASDWSLCIVLGKATWLESICVLVVLFVLFVGAFVSAHDAVVCSSWSNVGMSLLELLFPNMLGRDLSVYSMSTIDTEVIPDARPLVDDATDPAMSGDVEDTSVWTCGG